MAEAPSGWTIRQPSASALESLYGPGYRERLRRQKAETRGEHGFLEETIGPVTDEIAGYIPAVIDWAYGKVSGRPQAFGKLLDERLAISRGEREAYRSEHPVASTGANLLGALSVVPAAAAGAVGGALTYGGRLLAGAKAGAAGGAVGGAAEASGGAGRRAQGAAVGGAVGGALGTMIPVGLDVAGRLVRGVRNTLGITGRGATQRARQLLLEAMEKDGISFSDLANREASGKPLTLADLGPNTRDLIGAAHRAGGEAKTTIEKFFEERTKGQLGRMTGDLAGDIGEDPRAFRATTEELLAEKAKASPLYKRLYGKTTPMDEEMRGLLSTPAGKRAYGNALRWWSNKRRTMPKDGSIPFEVLDQTKKELDALIRYGKTPQGGAAIGGRSALEDLRSDFLATLDKRFKGYAAARYQSADPTRSLEAMEAGRKFLRAEGEDISADLAGMTPIERDLFRLGAARELRAKMGAKIDSGDISGMFQNENMRERLRAIFPDEETFARFMDATVTERTMQETRNAILKGSPTAARLAADEDLAQGALETAAEDVIRGRSPLGATVNAALRGARTAKERTVQGINQAVAGEIARTGVRTDLGDVGSRLAATPSMQPPALPVRPGIAQAPGGVMAGEAAGRGMEPPAPRTPAPMPEGWQIKRPAPPAGFKNLGPRSSVGETDQAIAGASLSLSVPRRAEKVITRAVAEGKETPALTLARSFTGLEEGKDTRVIGSFIKHMTGVRLDPRETPWCAAFVNAILRASGAEGTGKLNARSFLEFGDATDEPRMGDVAVFWRESPDSWKGHVGFYAGTVRKDGKEYIRVVGGNQDNSVSEKLYPKSQLLAYRRPPTVRAS